MARRPKPRKKPKATTAWAGFDAQGLPRTATVAPNRSGCEIRIEQLRATGKLKPVRCRLTPIVPPSQRKPKVLRWPPDCF